MQVSRDTFADLQAAVRAHGVRTRSSAAADSTAELEVRYAPTDPWNELSRQAFVDALRYFRTTTTTTTSSSTMQESRSVDVSASSTMSATNAVSSSSSYRVSFPSAEAFDAWRRRESEREREKEKTGAASSALASFREVGASVERVNRVGTPVDIVEYDLRVKAKEEVPLRAEAGGDALTEEALADRVRRELLHERSSVYVRHKHRFSVPAPRDPAFRIDLTSVHSYRLESGRQLLLSTSGRGQYDDDDAVRRARHGSVERFEAELEFRSSGLNEDERRLLGESEPDHLHAQLALRLLRNASLLLKVLTDSDHLIPRSKRLAVLDEYVALTGVAGRWQALGPKPVTLMRQNLRSSGSGRPGPNQDAEGEGERETTTQPTAALSVADGGYTLTEKADGERRMLFVSPAGGGEVYMLYSRGGRGGASDIKEKPPLAVAFTGLVANNPKAAAAAGGTLLDGEYLPALPAAPPSRPRARPPMFLCFDAFFVAGADVRGLPLWAPERRGMTPSPPNEEHGNGNAQEKTTTTTTTVKRKKGAAPAADNNGVAVSNRGSDDATVPGDRLGACERVVVLDGFRHVRPSENNPFECRVKTFYRIYTRADIARHSAHIFAQRNAGLFPYDIDGLVFTPADLALGASRDPITGAVIPASPSGAGSWTATFKWKPPEMSTIDFLVRVRNDDLYVGGKEEGDGVGNDGGESAAAIPTVQVRRVFDLYVGSDQPDPEPIDPVAFLEEAYFRGDDSSGDGSIRGGGGGGGDRGSGRGRGRGRGGRGRGPPPHSRPRAVYRPVLFRPPGEPRQVHRAHLAQAPDERVYALEGGGGAGSGSRGDEVRDESVVEFAYRPATPATPPALAWTPLRVRHDKTASKTMNSAKNAYDVWASIREPVTEEMLTTVVEEDDDVDEDDDEAAASSYYYASSVRPVARHETASYPMNAFHNAWIKQRTLLQPFSGRAAELLDLGTGQGGDVSKWFGMRGLERVLGVDLYEESLVRPKGGAYDRLGQKLRDCRRERQNPSSSCASTPFVVFAVADVRRPLFGPQAEGLPLPPPPPGGAVPDARFPTGSDGMLRLVRALWQKKTEGGGGGGHEEGEGGSGGGRSVALDALRGDALRRSFDLVTSHFAVHYFFSDARTLRTFVANVAHALRPGGFFAGACLDGARVDAKLRGLRVGEHIEGAVARDDASLPSIDRRRTVVWRITKMYDSAAYSIARDRAKGAAARDNDDDNDDRTGHEIKVYMETIGQTFNEYLVDMDLLVEAFAEVGMTPVSVAEADDLGLPRSSSATTTPGGGIIGDFADAFADLREKAATGEMNPEESADPRLAAALKMTDVHKEYSFLNRWFVFRKRTPTSTPAAAAASAAADDTADDDA